MRQALVTLAVAGGAMLAATAVWDWTTAKFLAALAGSVALGVTLGGLGLQALKKQASS